MTAKIKLPEIKVINIKADDDLWQVTLLLR